MDLTTHWLTQRKLMIKKDIFLRYIVDSTYISMNETSVERLDRKIKARAQKKDIDDNEYQKKDVHINKKNCSARSIHTPQ